MTNFIINMCRNYCINKVIRSEFMPFSSDCDYTSAILCTEFCQRKDANVLDLIGWKASYTQLRAYYYTRISDYNSANDWISIYSDERQIQINMKKPEIVIISNGLSVVKPVLFNELDFEIQIEQPHVELDLDALIRDLEN